MLVPLYEPNGQVFPHRIIIRMTDKDDVSVCLTSQEYDRFAKIELLYSKQKQEHQVEIANLHKIRQKQVAKLTEALEKCYAQNSNLTAQVNSLQDHSRQLNDQIKELEEKYQTTVNTVADLEAKYQTVVRELSQKNNQLADYKSKILELVSTIGSVEEKVRQKDQELKDEIVRLRQGGGIKNEASFQKQLKQFATKLKALELEKDDLKTKLKVADLRMQSKEEFVCNYYQVMKGKLSDFDGSQVREIINNDIDDFIRYLTTKKSVSATMKKK